MRLDYFVVFPNGTQHIDGVLGVLSRYKDLELVYFRKHEPYDFLSFVENIYKSDSVPWEHIKGKTEYLHSIGKECYIGLLKNHKPEEQIVGEGAYQHVQCMLINRFKWQVRELYNPRIGDERSEQHIIHASDYESQVWDMWKTLPYPELETFLIPHPSRLQIPYHLDYFDNYEITNINLKHVNVTEMTDGENITVPIKESIYFKYTQGDKKPYIEYWEKFRGARLWEDKSPRAFDDLIENYDGAGLIVMKGGTIQDGNHRASILLSRGTILCHVVNIL